MNDSEWKIMWISQEQPCYLFCSAIFFSFLLMIVTKTNARDRLRVKQMKKIMFSKISNVVRKKNNKLIKTKFQIQFFFFFFFKLSFVFCFVCFVSTLLVDVIRSSFFLSFSWSVDRNLIFNTNFVRHALMLT